MAIVNNSSWLERIRVITVWFCIEYLLLLLSKRMFGGSFVVILSKELKLRVSFICRQFA
jgi:hypothetical protein